MAQPDVPLYYRLDDYERYRERVGAATVVDVTRRTDPARIPRVWQHLTEVCDTYGPPWIVHLWTKDPGGVLCLGGDMLRRLLDAGTTLAAQVTITGLAGTVWEPLVPPDVIEHLGEFAALIGGPEHIRWRYDPIIPTVHDLVRFRGLAQRVVEIGVRQGVINFVAAPGRYKRVDRRLERLLPGWPKGMPGYDSAWRAARATELVVAARKVGLALACCAESAVLSDVVLGLLPAACADHAWFCDLSGRFLPPTSSRGSRHGCGCAPYFDVGLYGQWSRCHRCAYCYAG